MSNHPQAPCHVLRPVQAATRIGLLLLIVAMAACSGTSERLRDIRPDPGACRPGTFIGAMAGNCPQPVR